MNHYKSSIFRVIGLDPGLTNTGLCILDYDIIENKIIDVSTQNIVLDKLPLKNSDYIREQIDNRYAKLMAFGKFFREYLIENNPCVFTIEDCFYNPRRPNAFRAIVEQTTLVATIIHDVNIYLPVYRYTPMVVKKTIMEKANIKTATNKSNITTALSILYPWLDLTDKTEHEQDAIAIASTYIINNL